MRYISRDIDFIQLADEYKMLLKMQIDRENVVNRLHDKYKGLIAKEKIYIMYRAYRTTYINVKESECLLENMLDKEYRRIVYKKGTCRLIHIGKKE